MSEKSAEPAPWVWNLCSEQQQRHGKGYDPLVQKITTVTRASFVNDGAIEVSCKE